MQGVDIVVEVQVTSQINAEGFNAGTYTMFAVILFIVLLWIVGIVVQYTNFGNIPLDPSLNPTEVNTEDKKSKFALFFYSFNPIINLQKLVTVKEGGDQTLTVLNGVRVISICWVIIGHAFTFIQFVPILNIQTMYSLFDHHLFALVPGGLYAVDTFFFLSGFLSCYLLAVKAYPKKGKINWLLVYFHRYYRLIFPVVFVTFFSMFVIQFLADGPFYRRGLENIMRT